MNSATLSATTEREAINTMLSAIGETPVSSLEDDITVDAAIARNILRSISRQVQSPGLHSNTEKGYRISPNMAGEIVLPLNTMTADEIIPQGNPSRDLVVRGRRLYDRRAHTYSIGEAVLVDLVLLLNFEELPEVTRNYITIKAARVFHDRTLGDEALHHFTKMDEIEARHAFRKVEIRNKDANMLRNRHTVGITGRRMGLSLRRSGR